MIFKPQLSDSEGVFFRAASLILKHLDIKNCLSQNAAECELTVS